MNIMAFWFEIRQTSFLSPVDHKSIFIDSLVSLGVTWPDFVSNIMNKYDAKGLIWVKADIRLNEIYDESTGVTYLP